MTVHRRFERGPDFYMDIWHRYRVKPFLGPDPTATARPGDVLAVGPEHRWLAYRTEGVMCAACYTAGRLLRRDLRGWWVAGPRGERCAVADLTVARLVGTAPDGWPVLAEQAPLLGAELIAADEGVAS